MGGISFFLFGSRRISADGVTAPKLATLFLKMGVPCYQEPKGTYLIFSRDYERVRHFLTRLGTKTSEPIGFPNVFAKAKSHIFEIVAFILAVLINFLLSDILFDIRVSGNENVTEVEIEEALSDAGLYIGASFSRLDTSLVENETSVRLPSIGWININRRGTVAYVEIVERAVVPIVPEEDLTPSNIVAERDCVIEDIDVIAGVACVKPGDVVRRGDVLISGVVENEFGSRFVRAEGNITAYATEKLTVDFPRSETVISLSEYRLAEVSINIFQNYVNIFKNYRNSDYGCDIIVKSVPLATLNGNSLPLGFKKTYEPVYCEEQVEYSDSELIRLAMEKHEGALSELVSKGELVKISTGGEFNEEGYRVFSDIVYVIPVGVDMKIVND